MIDTPVNYTPDELDGLRQKLKDYKSGNGRSWSQIAGAIGMGESTLTAFANGTYNGKVQDKALEIDQWFRSAETLEMFVNVENVPGYLPLPTAESIRDIMTWAKRGNMTSVVSAPGIGKSMAETKFMNDFSSVWNVTASPASRGLNAFLIDILREMGTAIGNRNAHDLSYSVRRHASAKDKPLLIIDEAQHMGELAIEEVRAIHDKTGLGVAFFGNHEMTRTIDGTRTAQFAQRSSRISMREEYLLPQEGDVRMLLEWWNITNEAEYAFLRAVAMRPGGGALRQMTKVLDLATFVARGRRKARDITHIKLASDRLDTGVGA